MVSRRRRSLLLAALLGAALGAGALAALAEPPKGGFAPDPPGHPSKKQWLLDVVARDGKLTIEGAKAITVDKPVETPRVFGRFAIELWVGKELLDRARFNVPLMGDEPPQGNRNRLPRPRFDKGVSARMRVQLADHPRAAYLLLVDRESGDVQKLAWPPEPNGKLVPWTNGITDAKPGEVPGAGVKAVGKGDGGVGEGGVVGDAAPRPVDAGRD